MSTYRLEQDFKSINISDSGSPQQPAAQVSYGTRNVYSSPTRTPGRDGQNVSYQSSVSYSTATDNEMPKQKATFIRMVDPAYNPSTSGPSATNFNRTPEPFQPVVSSRQSPQPAVYPPSPSKPAPPPYTYSSDVYVPPSSPSGSYQIQSPSTATFSTTATSSGQQQASSLVQPRPPSPMQQERRDYETPVPQYTFRSSQQGSPEKPNKYPQGAPSRLLYSAPAPPAATGYAQSRPMGSTSPPQSPGSYGGAGLAGGRTGGYGQTPPRSGPASPTHQPRYNQESGDVRHPEPRPYLLKPTLDSTAPKPDNYGGSPQTRSPTSPTEKEAEVDALTNLLMRNMEAAADPDFFGYCTACGYAVIGAKNGCATLHKVYHIKCFKCCTCRMCAKCGQPIRGETTGCSALDQLFHIDCFTCVTCGTKLKGHPFFALEGKPYCEPCYMETLEKCSVCTKPITDRVLRATGKPYHPECFICVVCGRRLDGVPFTVDAANQIHCIEDFHKKFAPRCCVCNMPIMPDDGDEETVRIVAMDKSFHVKCYKCVDCGMVLSSEAEGRGCYPLDDLILCKSCNAQRINALTTKMTTEL